MKDASKGHKPIYRTASPFAQPTISQLQQPQHDAVTRLLVEVLRPIGAYRTNIPKQSKKKRAKKRKRKATPAEEAKADEDGMTGVEIPGLQPPRIQEDVLVGFNAVTRHLETLSTFSSKAAASTKEAEKPRHVAAVFLLRPLDDLIYSHLPALCHTASLAHAERPATRLVLLDPSVEKAVAAALARSPNVSVLAILEASDEDEGSEVLTEYVRKEVKAIDIPWLKQAMEAQWLGTQVDVQ
ncbi:hypothetical protein M409DRAFT_17948 [Zasmidium cellare ATCC 36951]|uniref:Uncharacterized protein n=1 Tax=Zasmidium cellare ATCC 36951 TaxID=1080233 RepID=A0A6A6CX61_ZASCE|nr:uncharacterized protein M409DRAFT_17948 [Zasmidium cellare ATCC 36951]KAF2171711.1 hypothetical protein M409DRAFT_17948 [Zasmidium cellare ATCC 36951]